MEYKPRLTRPEAGNKYYITRAAGGWSDAVKGSPTDKACDVLHNCVGYAYGRFNEIGGYGCCKYLRPVNAENFMQYKGNLESGLEPRLGACMVWQRGATLKGSDGAGHVAIVEQIISPTEIVTSESGYGAKKPFWTQRRKKNDGNWQQELQGKGYKFLGFIYNPAVPTAPVSGVPYSVRVTVPDLRIRTGPGTNYNPAGTIKPGVYTIVREATGAGATLWGKLKSGSGWIALDYAKRV